MNNFDSLCMGCFEELTDGAVCSKCGFDNDTVNDSAFLPLRFVLNNRYVVGKVLKYIPDGVCYLGYDTELKSVVVVKEFLPKDIANRLEGNTDVHIREKNKKYFDEIKESFLELWRTLAKLRSYNSIVTVYDIFEQNNTAYSVSEYLESVPLREFLLKTPLGYLEWEKARYMFMPVLTSLEGLHANGIVHGAICPDNLVLCRDGKVRITDYMIKEVISKPTELEFVQNDGYTAIEQFENSYKIGAWTDIYAFTACIYRALVGNNPPDSQSRVVNDKLMIPNKLAEQIPVYVIKAMGNGLQIYPESRYQNASELREQLNASPSVKAAGYVAPPKPEPEKEQESPIVKEEPKVNREPKKDNKNSKNKAVIIILVVLIIAAVGAGAYFYISKNTDWLGKKEETTANVEVAQYEVPDFSSAGYTQSDVENNGVWNSQFTISFVTDYSSDYEQGVVFKQDVSAGTSVDKGTKITLTVSKGAHTEQLPDVGGMSTTDATKTLEKLGFKVSTVSVYNDGSHAKDSVKSNYGMSPAAGTDYEVGKEVIIQVWGEVETTTAPTTTTTPSSSDNLEGTD